MALRNRILVVAIVATAAIVAVALWRARNGAEESGARPRPAQTAAAQLGPQTLRFPPGAPQLAYIKIEAVLALPEPLLEPLNARIAYDENRTARISSPIAGRVLNIAVQPGDSVRTGQALITLDAPDFAAASADAHKGQAELRQKQLAFERAKALYDGQVLARKDFESAEADLQQSEAEHSRARQRLTNLSPQQGAATGGKFVLRAPLDGVVTERQVNPGAEVRPDAAAPLFVITDSTHLWVIVDLPERYLGKMKVGQKVAIEVDAYPNGDFWGQVASIGEVLDPATRRVQVRCTVANSRRQLKPEMFARVTPIDDEREKRVRVPNAALIVQGVYTFVFVDKGGGVFEKRRVSLGLQGRDESYVKQGLAEEERIVTGGALLLNSELAGNE
jgi:cobalt-zinc-cadmium efflux system membrane fusion protein